MYMSNADPVYHRSLGMDLLKQGKDIFNNNKDIETRKKGYETYKKGLTHLVDYVKVERDPELSQKIKEHLARWIEEAQVMKVTLFPNEAQNQQPQNMNVSFNPNGRLIPNQQQQQQQQGNQNFNQQHENMAFNQQNFNQNNFNNANKSPKNMNNAPKIMPNNQNFNNGKMINEGNNNNNNNKQINTKQNEEDTKLLSGIEGAVIGEKPNVLWSDVAGLENAKNALMEAVILPIQYPNLFVGLCERWRGVLLYGPPGTGKTFLAKACASQSQATFYSITASNLMSKYVGETEKAIKLLFQHARSHAPSIIFIDEIDALLSERSDSDSDTTRRVKNEFLVQMEGVDSGDDGVLVLGATNLPWQIDSAAKRRFQRRIYIPLPDEESRKAFLHNSVKSNAHSLEKSDYEKLVKATEGYSCADMKIWLKDTFMGMIGIAQRANYFRQVDALPNGFPIYGPCQKEDQNAQQMKMIQIPREQLRVPIPGILDFLNALKTTKPTVDKNGLERYEKYTQDCGIDG